MKENTAFYYWSSAYLLLALSISGMLEGNMNNALVDLPFTSLDTFVSVFFVLMLGFTTYAYYRGKALAKGTKLFLGSIAGDRLSLSQGAHPGDPVGGAFSFIELIVMVLAGFLSLVTFVYLRLLAFGLRGAEKTRGLLGKSVRHALLGTAVGVAVIAACIEFVLGSPETSISVINGIQQVLFWLGIVCATVFTAGWLVWLFAWMTDVKKKDSARPRSKRVLKVFEIAFYIFTQCLIFGGLLGWAEAGLK